MPTFPPVKIQQKFIEELGDLFPHYYVDEEEIGRFRVNDAGYSLMRIAPGDGGIVGHSAGAALNEGDLEGLSREQAAMLLHVRAIGLLNLVDSVKRFKEPDFNDAMKHLSKAFFQLSEGGQSFDNIEGLIVEGARRLRAISDQVGHFDPHSLNHLDSALQAVKLSQHMLDPNHPERTPVDIWESSTTWLEKVHAPSVRVQEITDNDSVKSHTVTVNNQTVGIYSLSPETEAVSIKFAPKYAEEIVKYIKSDSADALVEAATLGDFTTEQHGLIFLAAAHTLCAATQRKLAFKKAGAKDSPKLIEGIQVAENAMQTSLINLTQGFVMPEADTTPLGTAAEWVRAAPRAAMRAGEKVPNSGHYEDMATQLDRAVKLFQAAGHCFLGKREKSLELLNSEHSASV